LTPPTVRLSLLPEHLAVCRLDARAELPPWAMHGAFWCVARTSEELSIVAEERSVPEGVRCERGWRGLKVAGPLDFGLTGILAAIAAPLAQAEISIFAVSTFDTDYVLVRQTQLEPAVAVLRVAGHTLS
jgi:hypothetical protein